jgi:hypothetical protein
MDIAMRAVTLTPGLLEWRDVSGIQVMKHAI